MPQKIRMPNSRRPISNESGIAVFKVLRSRTATKMLRATMPTNPAAIHSIVSMKRSIDARSTSLAIAGKTRRQEDPAAVPKCNRLLLGQSVVFGERGAQLGHRRVRIDADF